MLRRRKVNVGRRVSVAIRFVSKINIVGSLLYFDKLCAVSRILCTKCVSIAVTCISVLLSFSSPCLSVNFMSQSQGYMRE